MSDVGLVFLGWALAQVSDVKNRDMVARERCLQSLSELEGLFTRARNLASGGGATLPKYHELLGEIEKVIKRLRIERLGLIIFSYQLNHCLSESMDILDQYDPQHENLAYHPTQTLVRVQMAWSISIGRRIEHGKLDSIQQELVRGLYGRILKWPGFFCNELVRRARSRKKAKVQEQRFA
jgi:hypothetical protein